MLKNYFCSYMILFRSDIQHHKHYKHKTNSNIFDKMVFGCLVSKDNTKRNNFACLIILNSE